MESSQDGGGGIDIALCGQMFSRLEMETDRQRVHLILSLHIGGAAHKAPSFQSYKLALPGVRQVRPGTVTVSRVKIVRFYCFRQAKKSGECDFQDKPVILWYFPAATIATILLDRLPPVPGLANHLW